MSNEQSGWHEPNKELMVTPRSTGDLGYHRPSTSAVCQSRRSLGFAVKEVASTPIENFLRALRVEFERGVIFAVFEYTADSVLDWFTSRGAYDEYGFLTALINSVAFKNALPGVVSSQAVDHSMLFGLDTRRGPRTDQFVRPQDAFTLDGHLARLLAVGGAYHEIRRPASHPKKLAIDFVSETIGDDFEGTDVFYLRTDWSDWFADICWDFAAIWINRESHTIFLLIATDED